MKRLLLASLVLVPALVGCESTPNAQGASTRDSVVHAADVIDRSITELDATLTSLDQLVKSPSGDLNAQFKTYSANLSSLESSAEDVSELANKIRAKSDAYIQQWDAEIAEVQNEDLKKRTVERKEAVAASFRKMQTEYTDARQDFEPLLRDLRDIRTALKADLTMDGLKAVSGTAKKAGGEAEDVKESLGDLSKIFRDLGVRLDQRGPTPEPVKR